MTFECRCPQLLVFQGPRLTSWRPAILRSCITALGESVLTTKLGLYQAVTQDFLIWLEFSGRGIIRTIDTIKS